MNEKFMVAWVVLFAGWFLGSFVIHGLLLHADCMQVPTLYRTSDDSHMFFR